VLLPTIIFVFNPFENSGYYWSVIVYLGFVFLMIRDYFKGRIVYEIDENGICYNYFVSITTTETKLIPWSHIINAKLGCYRNLDLVVLTLWDMEVPIPVHGDLGEDNSHEQVRFHGVGNNVIQQVKDLNCYIKKAKMEHSSLKV
jgi:hypothetical protein